MPLLPEPSVLAQLDRADEQTNLFIRIDNLCERAAELAWGSPRQRAEAKTLLGQASRLELEESVIAKPQTFSRIFCLASQPT